MAFHGISCHFLSFPGISWYFLAFPGISWHFLAFPGISWHSPGIPMWLVETYWDCHNPRVGIHYQYTGDMENVHNIIANVSRASPPRIGTYDMLAHSLNIALHLWSLNQHMHNIGCFLSSISWSMAASTRPIHHWRRRTPSGKVPGSALQCRYSV